MLLLALAYLGIVLQHTLNNDSVIVGIHLRVETAPAHLCL
jgi:hypothetical protein